MCHEQEKTNPQCSWRLIWPYPSFHRVEIDLIIYPSTLLLVYNDNIRRETVTVFELQLDDSNQCQRGSERERDGGGGACSRWLVWSSTVPGVSSMMLRRLVCPTDRFVIMQQQLLRIKSGFAWTVTVWLAGSASVCGFVPMIFVIRVMSVLAPVGLLVYLTTQWRSPPLDVLCQMRRRLLCSWALLARRHHFRAAKPCTAAAAALDLPMDASSGPPATCPPTSICSRKAWA